MNQTMSEERLEQLEKKLADLEEKVQNQPTVEDIIEKLAERLNGSIIALQ